MSEPLRNLNQIRTSIKGYEAGINPAIHTSLVRELLESEHLAPRYVNAIRETVLWAVLIGASEVVGSMEGEDSALVKELQDHVIERNRVVDQVLSTSAIRE